MRERVAVKPLTNKMKPFEYANADVTCFYT